MEQEVSTPKIEIKLFLKFRYYHSTIFTLKKKIMIEQNSAIWITTRIKSLTFVFYFNYLISLTYRYMKDLSCILVEINCEFLVWRHRISMERITSYIREHDFIFDRVAKERHDRPVSVSLVAIVRSGTLVCQNSTVVQAARRRVWSSFDMSGMEIVATTANRHVLNRA